MARSKAPSKRRVKARAAGSLLGGPVERALWSVSIALFVLALLSKLAFYVWLGALTAELGFHLAVVSGLAALVALGRRTWWPGALASLTCVLLLWPYGPLYRPIHRTPENGPKLRVAHAHLAGAPLTTSALASWLGTRGPDVLAITGAPSALGGDARIPPYRTLSVAGAAAGTLLFVHPRVLPSIARRPLRYPLAARVRVGRCDVSLGVVTLPSLFRFDTLEARSKAIRSLIEAKEAPRSVWLGSLGSSAQASDLEPWLTLHHLRDARRSYGRLATAPAALGALGLPVDHILVHGWIGVREMSVESPLTQDAHRTLLASLELTEPRCR